MKILKENLWNRVFHSKQLQAQRQERIRLWCLINNAAKAIEKIEKATTLRELLDIHKEMWNDGLRNINLGPNEYGMFRTKDIADMKAEEVFLGDIYGLWTHTLPFWEKKREEPFGHNVLGIPPETTLYDLVMNQYRCLLRNNAKDIMENAQKKNGELSKFSMP